MTTIPHIDLSPEEQKRLQDLFNRLDVNKDGRIDVHDLTEALHNLKIPQVPGHAEKLLAKSDLNKDEHLDFAEFVQYVSEHEKQLKLAFNKLDRDKDGAIDANEIWTSLRNLGVHIDRAEAERLMKKMDMDKTLKVDWNEWRQYLILYPGSYHDLQEILHYWRHATIIDIGDNTLVPDDFTETELKTGMWWRHLVAGGAAGVVSRTCTAPLDRLKVLLQVHGSRVNNLGVITGFQHMLKEGGVKSLWRGNGINVIKIAPESALKFMAYEQIKRLMKGGKDRELSTIDRFCAGSSAGAISQSAIYPMEVIKTRLALRKTGQYKGIIDCACKLYQTEGLKCFYKGYLPNLIGIIPYAGIDLAVYETLKKLYISHHPKDPDPGILVLLTCGTLSSTCGQLSSYPLALVRTKLQAQANTGVGKGDTMVGLFKHILRTEGPIGLYRGITPNFMKVAPAVSISYVVYEHVRKSLGVQWA
ncbi:unnamed protein product [Owenia fusiformis]|uniref:Uncharacterized protein n=1 Tax=Owenia fusiformis TaxID=6347 RepID=A0A8J1TYJ5_OWEFU|nr:unnamed protein product [Owenia fusiformis]